MYSKTICYHKLRIQIISIWIMKIFLSFPGGAISIKSIKDLQKMPDD